MDRYEDERERLLHTINLLRERHAQELQPLIEHLHLISPAPVFMVPLGGVLLKLEHITGAKTTIG